jgi:hypothetical protein
MNVVGLHAVAVEAAEEVPILLLAVHLAFCRRVVELELLLWVPNGVDLEGEK